MPRVHVLYVWFLRELATLEQELGLNDEVGHDNTLDDDSNQFPLVPLPTSQSTASLDVAEQNELAIADEYKQRYTAYVCIQKKVAK